MRLCFLLACLAWTAGQASALPAVAVPADGVPWHIEVRQGEPVLGNAGQVRFLRQSPLPVCALTYDMERGSAQTRALQAQLTAADARATAFWQGSVAAGQTREIGQWAEAGFASGLHSWGHEHQTRLSDSRFTEGTRRVADLIEKATGQRTALYRFPWGEGSARATRLLAEMGLTPFYWSVDTSDYLGKSGERVAASGATCGAGGIVLMHDTKGSVAGCTALVAALRRKGLEPVDLPSLLRPSPAQPVFAAPGPIHLGAPTEPPQAREASRASSDGRWQATLDHEGVVTLRDGELGADFRAVAGATEVAWLPGGSLLAVAGIDGGLWLVNPDIAAAASAGHGPLPPGAIPGACPVSPPNARCGGLEFAESGSPLRWRSSTAEGAWREASCTVRLLTPWAVARLVAEAPVRATLICGDVSVEVTAPCLAVVPTSGSGKTVRAVVRAQGMGEAEITVRAGQVATARLTPDRAEPTEL